MKNIPTDKLLHFLVGFTVFTVFQYFGIYSLIFVILLGLFKEMYDKKSYGVFDKLDLVFTFVGGFFAYWLTLVYSSFK